MDEKQQVIWQNANIINWSQILVANYAELLGKELIANCADLEDLSRELFFAPFVVVSHGIEADPILNYGNKIALELWETTWEKLTKMPSRLTAETINRETRAKMLQQAAKKGYIDNYRGVRISSTGQRFAIENAVVWNLRDRAGNYCGQAATFSTWTYI